METIKNYKNKELVNEDFSLAKMPKIRNEFIAKLENALMFLNYKDLSLWHNEAKDNVHLKQFDGAWLVDMSLKHDENDDFTFKPFGDLQVTPDMFPDLNIKMMNLTGEIASLSKYKFLTLKEKRNLDNYKYIFSQKFGFLDYGKQKWWTDETGYGFNKINSQHDFNYIIPIQTSLKKGYAISEKDAIREIQEGIKDNTSMYFHMIKRFHIALQLSLTYYYEWSCYIKEKPDSIGIRIPIHPSSSKDVFVMRNIPEGNQRKRAIVNFVKDHYRTIKGCDDNEKKILVKKHLRGELKFNWRGLEVHVTPSPYDIKKIKTSKKFNTI